MTGAARTMRSRAPGRRGGIIQGTRPESGIASGIDVPSMVQAFRSFQARLSVPTPPDTYLFGFVRDEEPQAPSNGTEGVMKEVWVNKETVLSARDERSLERRLHSLKSALRRRDGSIVEVKRSAGALDERHVAVIRYELLLPQF
jgi:hypothetical protein